MNYKYNNGNGAVICDVCRRIVKSGLSYDEALKHYGAGPVLCRRCKEREQRKK